MSLSLVSTNYGRPAGEVQLTPHAIGGLKSHHLDTLAKAYIIDAVNTDGTPKERVQWLCAVFHSEFWYMVPRYGMVKALSEYFMGMPSSISIEGYHHNILVLCKTWGILAPGATEGAEERAIDNWFNLMAVKTNQLFDKYVT